MHVLSFDPGVTTGMVGLQLEDGQLETIYHQHQQWKELEPAHLGNIEYVLSWVKPDVVLIETGPQFGNKEQWMRICALEGRIRKLCPDIPIVRIVPGQWKAAIKAWGIRTPEYLQNGHEQDAWKMAYWWVIQSGYIHFSRETEQIKMIQKFSKLAEGDLK